VAGITDLEALSALHWRAPETERLGGWLLRAAEGFTGRANSALPLGDPGMDVADALATTRRWYGERGLPAKVSLAQAVPDGPQTDAGAAEPARAAAEADGWFVVPDGSAFVLGARPADLPPPPPLPAGLRLVAADSPDDAWLANYRYRGGTPPPIAVTLLMSAPAQRFWSVLDATGAVAVVRGSLAGGWVQLTALEVRPDARRQGLGSILVSEVARWGAEAGAVALGLQVGCSNEPAREFYARLGFTTHHRYDYLQAP
jgi:ribosomal protein S18 acetylase RimI-like enzyme